MSGEHITAIAAFIVKRMLDHDKLSLEILKSEFNLTDHQVREVLITLYYQNRIFGHIKKIDSGQDFLIFDIKKIGNEQPTLDEIIDWDIDLFDLKRLQSTDINESPETYDFESTHAEFEFSRRKETNQKDLISIETKFGLQCAYIQMATKLCNDSDELIKDITIEINFPEEIDYEYSLNDVPVIMVPGKVTIEMESVEPNQKINIVIYFSQSGRNGTYEFSGLFRYKTKAGYARIMRLEQTHVDITVPIFYPEKIQPEEIKVFMKNSKMVKKLQGFGVPGFVDRNLAHKYLDSVVSSMGFEVISKIENEYNPMTFFYAKSKSPNNFQQFNILVVPQLKGNVIVYYVCCEYDGIVSSLIQRLCYKFCELLRENNILEENQKLINMNCIQCGKLIELFPPKGEFVACSWCKRLQKPW